MARMCGRMLKKAIMNSQPDPLHGVTLKMMLTELQAELGWEGLAERININCFSHNPSLKSSLTFLRKTPWARQKVEYLYMKTKGIKIKHKPVQQPKQLDDNPWLKGKS